MPYKCSVYGCKGNYTSGPKVSVFKFPTDPEAQDAPIAMDDSCLDKVINVEDLSSVLVSVPEFKSFSGSDLKVKCDPMTFSNYSTHVINCVAYDTQLRISGYCSFQIDINKIDPVAEFQYAESYCLPWDSMMNGKVYCNNSISNGAAPQTLCEIICDDGYVILKSELNYSIAICGNDGEWNKSLSANCTKAEHPKLISGCISKIIETSNPALMEIAVPEFRTFCNTSANVTCLPNEFEDFKEYEVICTAEDSLLNTETSCVFFITFKNNNSEKYDNFSTLEIIPETSTEQQLQQCMSLTTPAHAILNCSSENSIHKCSIGCEEGYSLSSANTILQKGFIICNSTSGLWDFQVLYNSAILPDCLALLPNTTVRVSSYFNVSVEECSADTVGDVENVIKDVLLSLNDDICGAVDCNSLNAECFRDGNKFTVAVNWTLETAYDPLEFENSVDVPEFEKNFETVLERTKTAIKDKLWLKEKLFLGGIQLHQNSFKQGRIVLACSEDGYGVDALNNKCLACPSGTMESYDECLPCDVGYFQLESKQKECNVCPTSAVNVSDSVITACNI